MTMNTAAGTEAGGGVVHATRSGEGAPVALTDLSRSFGAVRALAGLSLEIAPGELVALLGPSGCGKTTALRILAGFEAADSGSVTVDGKDISRIPAAKRDMGMVFQSYSLFPNMTALDNVGFGLRMRKRSGSERGRRASELLDMVGLSDQAKKYPNQMSGGQQQRVAIARALVNDPSLILADEPTGALDTKSSEDIMHLFARLNEEHGMTIMLVTHEPDVGRKAKRIVTFRDGKIVGDAPAAEAFKTAGAAL